ncbi:hypothetical protein BRUCa_1017 [Brucella melitensis]|nr:hypothetical protein BM28_A1036 [Brucella melitensis M28]ADZ86970.1 hypothetical protein BM590_A1027 [Brucella melitensis M5-90]AEW17821.1 hypothetical protein BAA13334_I02337 [Brucella abortus A13334]EPZ76630.1 hypothetical protein M798_01565 [Brucella melitensis ADMAS-G1]
MTGHIKIFGQFAKMKFGLVRRDLFQKPVDQLSTAMIRGKAGIS